MKSKKIKKGFTLVEMMVVIVIIGILISIAQPNFVAAQQRAKIASVKSNMRNIQMVAETYSVDWGGIIADDINALRADALANNYWKEFRNPMTGRSGLGQAYSSISEPPLSPPSGGIEGESPTIFPFGGMVAYLAFTQPGQATEEYIIVGSKSYGNYIKDKGRLFFLTNGNP